MSYTELHTGQLEVVIRNTDRVWFKDFIKANPHLEVDDLDDRLEDGCNFFIVEIKGKGASKDRYKYLYSDGTLYEFVNHEYGESSDYLNKVIQVNKNTINFTCLFYNGGTCFSEMLEEGFNCL